MTFFQNLEKMKNKILLLFSKILCDLNKNFVSRFRCLWRRDHNGTVIQALRLISRAATYREVIECHRIVALKCLDGDFLLLLTTAVATTEINSLNTIVTYTMVIKGQTLIFTLLPTPFYSLHLFKEITTGSRPEVKLANQRP